MGGPIPLSGTDQGTAGLGLSLEVMGVRASSTQAKQLHPGSASTLPNSSLFPPVPMATCDLTGFLGALPAFSAEIRPVTRVVLLSSLSGTPGAQVRAASAAGLMCHTAAVTVAPGCPSSPGCRSPWGYRGHQGTPCSAQTPDTASAHFSKFSVFQTLTVPSA